MRHKNFVVLQQSTQAQYNCNTSFLQLLQVACKFSVSCRKLVLPHYIAGVRTSAMHLHYKKKVLVLQLCCSCIALVRTTLVSEGIVWFGVMLCVCPPCHLCRVSTAHRISLGDEGNVLYPVLSSYLCVCVCCFLFVLNALTLMIVQ